MASIKYTRYKNTVGLDFSTNTLQSLGRICELFGVSNPLYVSVYSIRQDRSQLVDFLSKDYIIRYKNDEERSPFTCFAQIDCRGLSEFLRSLDALDFDELVIDGCTLDWKMFVAQKSQHAPFFTFKKRNIDLAPFFYLRHLLDGETELICDLEYGRAKQVRLADIKGIPLK